MIFSLLLRSGVLIRYQEGQNFFFDEIKYFCTFTGKYWMPSHCVRFSSPGPYHYGDTAICSLLRKELISSPLQWLVCCTCRICQFENQLGLLHCFLERYKSSDPYWKFPRVLKMSSLMIKHYCIHLSCLLFY